MQRLTSCKCPLSPSCPLTLSSVFTENTFHFQWKRFAKLLKMHRCFTEKGLRFQWKRAAASPTRNRRKSIFTENAFPECTEKKSRKIVIFLDKICNFGFEIHKATWRNRLLLCWEWCALAVPLMWNGASTRRKGWQVRRSTCRHAPCWWNTTNTAHRPSRWKRRWHRSATTWWWRKTAMWRR